MKKIFISILLPFFIIYAKELPLIKCNNSAIDINKLKSERVISPNGQGSEFYFKVGDKIKKVIIDEKPRASQISKDLVRLIQTSMPIIFRNKSLNENNYTKECVLYKQSFKRAYVQLLTIDNNNNSTLYTFKVGEIEHLYLTTDMPISSIKELSYNQETQTLYEKKQPSAFYLGVNYKLGDIYTNYSIDEFYNDLSLKAIIKVSNKPTKSMGLGIGYHLSKGIEVFIAKVWTQYSNIDIKGSGYTPTTTYGISFDLNKALDWLQNQKL